MLRRLPPPWHTVIRPYGNGTLVEVRASNGHTVVEVTRLGGVLDSGERAALADLLARAPDLAPLPEKPEVDHG